MRVTSISGMANQLGFPINPVVVEVSRSFQNPIADGDSDTITYSVTNTMPWALKKPLVINKIATPANEFSYVDNCTGQLLGGRDSGNSNCLVTVTLSPTIPGTKSLQLSVTGFSSNELLLPTQVTQSFQSVRSTMYGVVDLEVPALYTQGSSYPFTFRFVNRSNAPVQTQLITLTAHQGSVSSSTDSCTNTTLGVGASCTVTGLYTTPNNDNGYVTASLAYNNGQSASVGTNVGGRLVAYVEGWNAPPSTDSIIAAGYTHLVLAFGLFSTQNSGQIITSLDGIPSGWIQTLQNAGVKVLLSIGGASANLANTTVNFDEAYHVNMSTFVANVVSSMESLQSTYGLDGFDLDIEQGFSPAPGGTMTDPGGDIPVLAEIITQYHTAHPDQLITLAPQTANISATSAINNTFGNYSALIMQAGVPAALSWVGVQNYNAGCSFAINCDCVDPNTLTTTPDAAVAFAEDLLVNWPSTCPAGQASGFLPYISYLNASQVVLGFPLLNGAGVSDGSPPANPSVVNNAIQCLRTGTTGCGTYIPTQSYPSIGGVFGWTLNADSSNNYQFASSVFECVVNGVC